MQFRFYAAAPQNSPLPQPKIDSNALTIKGLTAMQSGVEALGHGCMTDDKTLEMMLALAQGNPKGFFRQRFGHPGISENATGKQVAQAYNFRISNGNLLHDSKLLDSARKSPAFSQDPIDYILDIAERNPSEFGESVVIDADLVWKLADGREIPRWPKRDEEGRIQEDSDIVRDAKTYRPITATTPLPLLRPIKFYYVDFVGEGALTHEGLFPEGMNKLFSTGVNAYAEELFSLVDNWIESYGIPLSELPKKTDQLLQAYMNARSKDEQFMKRNRSFAAASAQKYEDTGPEVSADEIVQTEPQEEADPLDGLEEMAAQIGTVEFTELQSEPGVVEAIQAEQAELRAMLTTLASRFDRMVGLLQSNLEATATIQRNVTRLSGEPVVTQRVPKAAKPAMEQLSPQFAHPSPNGATQMLFARGAGNQSTMFPAADEFEELEPAQAAMLRREKLQKQTVFNMEKTGGRSQ